MKTFESRDAGESMEGVGDEVAVGLNGGSTWCFGYVQGVRVPILFASGNGLVHLVGDVWVSTQQIGLSIKSGCQAQVVFLTLVLIVLNTVCSWWVILRLSETHS